MPAVARTHQLKQSLIYHLYNRGNARSQIFHDPEDYQYFINLILERSKRHSISVYHWVLMPNHYHLLVEIADPEKISSIMAGLARSYVYYHHKKYDSAGHLWQGRFKSQPIQKELYLLSCGRYIERNPVKANIVTFADVYRYSSASYYLSDRIDGLTTEDPLFKTFGNDLGQRREKYREFLQTFDLEEERLFKNIGYPRGSKEFTAKLVKGKGLYLPRRRGRTNKVLSSIIL